MFGPIRAPWHTAVVAVVLTLTLVLGFAPAANALYTDILYENWEKPINQWPFTTFGNTWGYFPNPPSFTQPTWDVEYDAIYHQTAPGQKNSVWCVGSNDQLQPGIDPYLPNVTSFLYWGPFNLDDAIYANGVFWYWAKMEANNQGSGDYFRVGVRQGGFSPNLADWDFLFMDDGGGTSGTWQSRDFDFDEVINGTDPSDTLSYLGLNNLTIALIFVSDFDQPQDEHLGVFVDEFGIGKDDGLFDFKIDDVTFVDPDNNDYVYSSLFVGQPAQVMVDFTAYGSGMSEVVDHTLYDPNNNVADVITQAWEGSRNGMHYSELFDPVFTPSNPGEVSITVLLNSQFSQEEADYSNNDSTVTVTILPENQPPTLSFITPAEGGTPVDEDADEVDIVFEAYNYPEIEDAWLDLYWDYDGEGFDGTEIADDIFVENGEQSRTWTLIGFPNDDYWIYGIIDDGFNEPDSVYSLGPIMYGTADVADWQTSTVPGDFEILSAYPNPFNPTVEIRYALPAPGKVTAAWYSVDGRLVEKQSLGNQNAGQHAFAWTPNNLTSGVYLLQLQSPTGTLTQKVTYLK